MISDDEGRLGHFHVVVESTPGALLITDIRFGHFRCFSKPPLTALINEDECGISGNRQWRLSVFPHTTFSSRFLNFATQFRILWCGEWARAPMLQIKLQEAIKVWDELSDTKGFDFRNTTMLHCSLSANLISATSSLKIFQNNENTKKPKQPHLSQAWILLAVNNKQK